MKNIALGLVLLCVLALVGCQKPTEESSNTEPTTTTETMETGEKEGEGKKIMTGLMVPKLELYHGATCPHCHDFKAFLPTLEEMYPGMVIEEYEVWNDPVNAEKARKRLAELGEEFGSVPTIVIGSDVVVGNNQSRVVELMQKNYGDPVEG